MGHSRDLYLARVNVYVLWLLVAHVPVLMGVAAWFGTGVVVALTMGTLLVVGPAVLALLARGSLLTSVSAARAQEARRPG